MTDLNVQTDFSEADNFLKALPREIFNATRSAIKTTTTWTEKTLEKKSAEKTKIPLKAFRDHRVFSRANDTVGNVWFGFASMRARYLGKIGDAADGAFAGSYYFRGTSDHYFAAKMGAFRAGWETSTGGVQSIWKRRYDTRFPVTEGRANISNLESLADEIAASAEAELLTRFSKKIDAYIEKRESAA